MKLMRFELIALPMDGRKAAPARSLFSRSQVSWSSKHRWLFHTKNAGAAPGEACFYPLANRVSTRQAVRL